MHIVYPPGQGLNACAKYEFDPDKVVCITVKESSRVRLRSPELKFQTLCLYGSVI